MFGMVDFLLHLTLLGFVGYVVWLCLDDFVVCYFWRLLGLCGWICDLNF